MYPLAAGFGFESVPLRKTPVSLFVVGNIAVEHSDHVLAEVETEAKKVLGSFGTKEYDALGTANIPNDAHLNRVLEQMGVLYATRPLFGSEASQVVMAGPC
jgi:hypothetical protein